MAAGLTQRQKASKTYNWLQSLRRDLLKAGVSTVYERATVNRRGKVVFFTGDGITFPKSDVDGGFNISLNWGNMSNGESFGTARLYLVLRGETKVYTGWGDTTDGSFSEGLDIVRREFKGVLGGTMTKRERVARLMQVVNLLPESLAQHHAATMTDDDIDTYLAYNRRMTEEATCKS
jgi:hypothetical protein